MPIRTTARTAAFIPGEGYGTCCELNTPTTCVGFPLGMSKTNRSAIFGGCHGRNVDAELHSDQLNFWTCSNEKSDSKVEGPNPTPETNIYLNI